VYMYIYIYVYIYIYNIYIYVSAQPIRRAYTRVYCVLYISIWGGYD